jgi:hypothetical protein
MADQKLVIQIGTQQVTSELRYDASDPNWTRIWITSTCGGYNSRNVMSIDHRTAYSAAQAEHDIEDARWQHAGEVAAKASIRSTVSGLILPVGKIGSPGVRTVSAKEHPAPTGK